MKFKKLEIQNFRAITNVKLDNLEDVVLVAGPNGCGKSCIFDAIRLFKSVYGEYFFNELNNWFSEFQVGINQNNYQVIGNSLLAHFQDIEKTMRVYGELVLAVEEIEWLKENLDFIINNFLWKRRNPQHPMGAVSISEQARFFQEIPEELYVLERQKILNELNEDYVVGELIANNNQQLQIRHSPILEKIFSIYNPNHIGIIDYHGPQRNYNREQMNQVNLSLETRQQNYSQHALYNTTSKYNNVKTELASSYIMSLLSEKAGENPNSENDLNKTLIELFSTFFPDKTFLDPIPTKDGKLTFNVKTSFGAIHDIDALSSGEKEILYGYLRIRNSAPQNSVLLIDEPELHLNPKLTQGLPMFYHRHLGKALNNQIWLVTHSDTLLRQSLGQENFGVFHLQKAELNSDENQVKEISASDEVEKAVIDLVGDLAAYRPGAKLVIVEGGGNSDFDVQMIKQLFPDFESRVNLESGGSRKQVFNFHELLEKTKKSGSITTEFFSIADKDFEIDSQTQENRFFWDRFHIENYLLETQFILKVIFDLQIKNSNMQTETDIENLLKECAKKTVHSLVRGQMEHSTNQKLVQCIRTNTYRNSEDISEKLIDSIENSITRLRKIIEDDLSNEKLKEMEKTLSENYENDLVSDAWKNSFRGRDILKLFVSSYLKGISYNNFRNLIITKMRNENFQPKGMKKILDVILSK